ncbi:MBL fold metallo-hydrolase [Pseudomonas sp. R5(2019)]|uniref:MBL fold metallo-hydrolase n=1 Tax=Pseudomonas sp. R5(2019) TaxID=2697566 RepID=UPI00141289AF|nr:MBL fold metallo-hydrolase [Pseudomonas sp. R5(2019)]NBA93731.1 MBL fold metallo-hydrolase [Pseudomonas sp. R5(2019)]
MGEIEAGGEVRNGLRFPFIEPPPAGHTLEIAPGLLWLRMPLPFGLDHINLYLLRHGEGWVVVDSGLNTDVGKATWEQVLSTAMANLPIVALIATHFHHDHTGLMCWLAERFRCPLYMTAGEFQALHVLPGKGATPGWEFEQFYRQAGLEEEEVKGLVPVINDSVFHSELPRSFRRLRGGQTLQIGTRRWQVVIGSGHSPEHACLYCPQDQLLISGDQVLPRITSSVCVAVTEPLANPLGDWLNSVEQLRSVPDSVLVLPAHERPFYGLHQRLDQLRSHHEVHLRALTEQLRGPMSAAQIRPILFPKIKNRFDLLMALGETLAHLHLLVEQGVLLRERSHGVYRFCLSHSGDQPIDLSADIHL